MDTEIKESERAALEVLRSTGVDVLEAALVAKEALECGRGRARRARECVRLGAEEMRKRERTVTFRKAVEMALEEREKKEQTGADGNGFPLLLQAADGAESGVGGAAGAEHHIG